MVEKVERRKAINRKAGQGLCVVMWTKDWTTKYDLCNTLLLVSYQLCPKMWCHCVTTRQRKNMPEANTAPES